jgi:gamma-glutamyltranspeptidase / glutathione hydrolase
MFLDEKGKLTDRSVNGHLAAGVPGSVAGLWEAHRRLGSIPWAQLVAPAIELAEAGFRVDESFSLSIEKSSGRLAAFPASAALFLPEGKPPPPGARWRNPDLAATLRRIALEGPGGFYRGETAERLVEEMSRGGGLVSHDDLPSSRSTAVSTSRRRRFRPREARRSP